MPSVLAAAIGPGVGGMNTCDVKRPAARPTDIATEEAAVLFTRALRIGLRITNPESQKTGIDTTHPISSIARTGCFLPTILITMSASLRAAPVCSRMLPIRAPRIITIPMEVKVPEKPCPITVAIPALVVPSSSLMSAIGIPAIRPRTSEINMIEMNGWILNLEIRTIIQTIARMNTIISGNPVMFLPSRLLMCEITHITIFSITP